MKPLIGKSNLGSKWKWRFLRNYSVVLPLSAVPMTSEIYTIHSRSGRALVELKGNTLKINRHYHFNGADYAIDWKSQLPQTARHDAMLQLAEKYEDITTDMAHEAFKPISEDKFKPMSWWRWGAVRIYWAFKR